MPARSPGDDLLAQLRSVIVSLVRRDGPDLTTRQFGVFLTVYLTKGPHTVRGLACALNIDKSGVTRGLDRLAEFGLARRRSDPKDRRSVLIRRTVQGAALLRELHALLGQAVDLPEG